MRLDALGLRPVDLVALARTQPTGLGDGELDRRVLAAAGAPAGAQVVYGTTSLAWSLADAVELAAAIGGLLTVARPLAPSDLILPADAGGAAFAPAAAAEAAARAQAALDQLASDAAALSQALAAVTGAAPGAATASQLAALRAALQQAAAFGIDGAYPAGDADASALTALATGIQKELAARQAAAGPADPSAPDAGAPDPAALAAAAAQTAQAVFGRDFLLLPHLAASDLAAPLAASPALVGDLNAPRQALQQLARVRANLGPVALAVALRAGVRRPGSGPGSRAAAARRRLGGPSRRGRRQRHPVADRAPAGRRGSGRWLGRPDRRRVDGGDPVGHGRHRAVLPLRVSGG